MRIARALALLLLLTAARTHAAEPNPRAIYDEEAALLHRRVPLRALLRLQDGEFRAYAPPPARLYVINLWSTRCAPCVAELPFLQRLAAGWRGVRGVRFLFVADPPEENAEAELLRFVGSAQQRGAPSPDSAQQRGAPFIDQRDAPLRREDLLRSGDGSLRGALGTGVQPITLLCDSDLVIRQAWVGSVVHRGAELAASMTRLLQVLPRGREKTR